MSPGETHFTKKNQLEMQIAYDKLHVCIVSVLSQYKVILKSNLGKRYRGIINILQFNNNIQIIDDAT